MKSLQQYVTITKQHFPTKRKHTKTIITFLCSALLYYAIHFLKDCTLDKNLLVKAWVHTYIFEAHLVCEASAIAALNKSVPLSDTLSTADWSRDSTFRTFYYRPIRIQQICRVYFKLTTNNGE